jgi:outer membrane protein OmpA-like peptidoglycan-associated protein
MHFRTVAVVALMSGLAASLPAQSAGTIEFGGFGRYTKFDQSLGLDNAYGAGGYLGVFIAPGLAIEGTGGYLPTTGPFIPDGTLIPLRAQLVYGRPLVGSLGVMMGAGYVHNIYGKAANYSDDGASGLFGLRLGLGSSWAMRVEAVEDFIPSPQNQSVAVPNNWNFSLQAGLTALIGNNRPKDSDHDGVGDRFDTCPNTPPGVSVDAHGCPLPKDSDGDGVVDNLDRCPNTPPGDKVDAGGCSLPKDVDGDGVADNLDKCPNTPPGVKVDTTGCELDTDKDGVPDSADKCPNTPAGDKVDATGCPTPKDSDGDGVVDAMDKCPSTPVGEKVDAIGCPQLFTGVTRTLVLEGVVFEPNSTALTAGARGALDRVAIALTAHGGTQVEIAGYTDNRGGAAANLRLSKARADAVRSYLIERGVSPEQLTARGYGADDPVDSNATAVGRSKNRRVELHKTN